MPKSYEDFVPGRNYKSVRIARIKRSMDNYSEKMDMPFTRGLALLRELLTIGTVSARNCLFARKFIHEKMHPFFRDEKSVVEMDRLNLLFQKAEERRAHRKEKKLLAKAEGTYGVKRTKKDKQSAPVSKPPAIDVWELL